MARNDSVSIRQIIDDRLSGMQENPHLEEEVFQKINGGVKVKRKVSAMLVLAVLLVLVAGIALAITYSDVFFKQAAKLQQDKGNLSTWTLAEKRALIETMAESGIEIPDEKATLLADANLTAEDEGRLCDEILVESKLAREALQEKYAFSYQTFAWFDRTVSFVPGDEASPPVWQVSYTPRQYADAVGSYEVRIAASTGEVVSATWSHDAADLQPDNWYANVWRAALLDRLQTFGEEYDEEKAAMEAELGDYAAWSLADKAKLDQLYVDTGYPMDDNVLNVLPGEDDLPEAEAVTLAMASITEKYDVPADTLAGYTQQLWLFETAVWDERLWIIELYHPDGGEKYVVELWSPSQAVQLCGYYKEDGAVTADEKELFTASEEQSIRAAWQEMQRVYGFDEAVAAYFNAAVEHRPDNQVCVTFTSNNYNPAKVGKYAILLEGQTGEALSSTWELQQQYAKQGACEPWREAVLWSAYEYNCYARLRTAAKAILDEVDGLWDMSFEQRAAYDTLYRNAGYDRTQYYHGTPGVLDMPLDGAIEAAKQAVKKNCKIKDDEVAQAVISYDFDVSDATQYKWIIRIAFEGGRDELYTVEIDSSSGTIISIKKQQASNG